MPKYHVTLSRIQRQHAIAFVVVHAEDEEAAKAQARSEVSDYDFGIAQTNIEGELFVDEVVELSI